MLVGIDLGTTNSLISIYKEGNIQVIPNRLGERLTPSVVCIDNDQRMHIGRIAREKYLKVPKNCARNFKLNMGTNKAFKLGKSSLQASDLSSLVLKSLIEDAEIYSGEKVTEAVISVPAYFNDLQRKDTILAAELAGIKVRRLINEPTAAAIAYNIDGEDDATYLIFDLGGGTFDVSIVEKFDDVIEVHSSTGDNHLGGSNFTQVIVDYIETILSEQHGIKVNKLDSSLVQLIYNKAEQLKLTLSENNELETILVINEKEIKIKLSAAEYENLCAPLLDRLFKPLQRALNDAKIDVHALDAVVLVGGGTKLHMVRKLVTKATGKFPLCNLNPDEVVCMGAGIMGELLKTNSSITEKVVTDVTPFTLGVETFSSSDYRAKSYFSPILERNTIVPCSREEIFHPIGAKQKKLDIKVYQGESRDLNNNVFLGQLEVPVTLSPATDEAFSFRFTYDVSGLLEVEVKSLATNKVYSSIFNQNELKLTKEEMEKRFKKLANIKIHPREKEENTHIIKKLERIFEEVILEQKNYISEVISDFERALESQDNELIDKYRKQANEVFEYFSTNY